MKWNCIFRLLTPFIHYPISMPLFIGGKIWTLAGVGVGSGMSLYRESRGWGRQGPQGSPRVTVPRSNFCTTMTEFPHSFGQEVCLVWVDTGRKMTFSQTAMFFSAALKASKITTAHVWKMPLWVQNPIAHNVRSNPDSRLVRRTYIWLFSGGSWGECQRC